MNTLNQTLQEKFPHLELSVLKLSEAKKDNESFRIDSEPFKKSNLQFNANLSYIRLDEITNINPSKLEISYLDKNTKVTFLSMQNLGNGVINDKEEGTIRDFENGYTYFAENDILIAKITPCMEHGKCAIAIDLKNKIGFGSTEFNVFRVKDSRFLKEFVFCYLDREVIRKIATDNMVGTSGRQRVPTAFYEKLLIPLLPMPFQLEIEKLVKDSHLALEQSKALYKEAEDLLYTELGLNPQNPLQSILQSHNNNINFRIATLKESFLKTGRLDSEYYQVKYEEIEKRIKTYTNGYCKLKDIVVSFSGGFAFSSNEYLENGDLALIRINNIKNANLDMNNAVYLNDEAISLSPKDKVKKGDVLISMSGSIGLSCVVRENLQAMVNQRILKISIDDFNADVLVLLLNSVLCKLQFERIGTGGVQTNLATSDILNILIPKINPNTQDSITSHIQKSFALRAEAKNLLNEAKAKVESAIIGGGG